VSRRAPLPGAAELFRSTDPAHSPHRSHPAPEQLADQPDRSGSGRQKHASKITVYISEEELYALEHARLVVRAQHGLVADRGRIVREAVAVLLADFDEHGEDSLLVRRLRRDPDQ
jgi:hypothetical protein